MFNNRVTQEVILNCRMPTGHGHRVFKNHESELLGRIRLLLQTAGLTGEYSVQPDSKNTQHSGQGRGIAIQWSGNGAVRIVLPVSTGYFRVAVRLDLPFCRFDELCVDSEEFVRRMTEAANKLNDYWRQNPKAFRDISYRDEADIQVLAAKGGEQMEDVATMPKILPAPEAVATCPTDQPPTAVVQAAAAEIENAKPSTQDVDTVGYIDAALAGPCDDPCGYHRIEDLANVVANLLYEEVDGDEEAQLPALVERVKAAIWQLAERGSPLAVEIYRSSSVRRAGIKYPKRTSVLDWAFTRHILPLLLDAPGYARADLSVARVMGALETDRRREISQCLNRLKAIEVLAEGQLTMGRGTSGTFSARLANPDQVIAVYPSIGIGGGVAVRLNDPSTWEAADRIAEQYLEQRRSKPAEVDSADDKPVVMSLVASAPEIGLKTIIASDHEQLLAMLEVIAPLRQRYRQELDERIAVQRAIDEQVAAYRKLLDLQCEVNQTRVALGLEPNAISAEADALAELKLRLDESSRLRGYFEEMDNHSEMVLRYLESLCAAIGKCKNEM